MGQNPLIWNNLHFVAVRYLTNDTCKLTVFGHVGHNYSLMSSTNLINWSSVLNFGCTNATMDVLDQGETNSSVRFYRLLSTD